MMYRIEVERVLSDIVKIDHEFDYDPEEEDIRDFLKTTDYSASDWDVINFYPISDKKYSIDDVIKMIMGAEIAIPIDRFFTENGGHITKQEYGLVLLEVLCKELKEKY
jgi:hypothetical protein